MGAPIGRPGRKEDVGDRGAHGSAVGRDLCRPERPELVERARDRADRLGRHLGVEGGIVELCVPEQDRDDPNIHAVLQQVGGEALAQRMRPDPLDDIGGLGRLYGDPREQPAVAMHLALLTSDLPPLT
jgi:hypothetical protein